MNDNNDTKIFTKLGKCLLNVYFLTLFPRALFRTQPKVELFHKNSLQISAVNFFCKKAPP